MPPNDFGNAKRAKQESIMEIPDLKLRGNIRHSVVCWPYQAFGEQWDLETV